MGEGVGLGWQHCEMSTKHESLCQTKGCPTRLKGFKGDVNDWHIPWCGHGLEGHHHHVKKRSQGGTKGDIVFICPDCHQRIDERHWGNAVLDIPGVGRVYRVWDQNNRTVFERIIEAAPDTEEEECGGRRLTVALEDLQPPTEALPVVKESTLPAAQYSPTGLQLPEDMSFEKWQELGGTLQTMGKGLPWWLGDYLQYGERRYGERYTQAIEETGMDKGRLANYAWVAGKVEPSTRVETLSWSHHREVADLEPGEQKAWLQRAQDESMTVNELRKAISVEEPDVCPDSATGEHDYRRVCRHCGKER